MNKYKINPLLIHIKEKEQTVCASYVVVLIMQNAQHTPILNGIIFLVTSKFFSRNQMETRQENVNILLDLENLRCVFAKLLMYRVSKKSWPIWSFILPNLNS